MCVHVHNFFLGGCTDPNVEVIYLTPTPLGEEITDYYHQLLAMGPAGNHSKDRVHFVSPENSEYFNSHNMALSTLFLYSPLSLARIQRLFAGRESYIVSGTVSKDDLEMAYKLGKSSSHIVFVTKARSIILCMFEDR